MKIQCRAKISKSCYDGTDCESIYGEDSMSDDGTFDGKTVVCDVCYIAGGQPAVSFPASREQVVAHDHALGLVRAACGHTQSRPTDEEIAGDPEVITRSCPTCERPLWWNIDQWKAV